jgi:hypothetical protein
MLNSNPVLRVSIRPLPICGVWTKNYFAHPSFLLFGKQLNMKLWISGITMKLLNHHLIKYILSNSLFRIMAIVSQSRFSSSCLFVWKENKYHVKKTKIIKSMHVNCDLKTRRNFSSDNSFSFYSSEQVGDVELDDVWFAYPSRPNHMVLQIN